MAGEKEAGRPVGATGTAARKNIRRIRDARGISAAWLSEQLNDLGRPIPPLGISRIENGQRRIDVDDLMAIAVALGVSPATLLMPLRNDDGSEVEEKDLVPITGWHKPNVAKVVWEWLKAERPLVHGTFSSFVQLGWPAWERRRFDEQILQQIARQQGTYVGETIWERREGEEEVGRSLRLGLPDSDKDANGND